MQADAMHLKGFSFAVPGALHRENEFHFVRCTFAVQAVSGHMPLPGDHRALANPLVVKILGTRTRTKAIY